MNEEVEIPAVGGNLMTKKELITAPQKLRMTKLAAGVCVSSADEGCLQFPLFLDWPSVNLPSQSLGFCLDLFVTDTVCHSLCHVTVSHKCHRWCQWHRKWWMPEVYEAVVCHCSISFLLNEETEIVSSNFFESDIVIVKTEIIVIWAIPQSTYRRNDQIHTELFFFFMWLCFWNVYLLLQRWPWIQPSALGMQGGSLQCGGHAHHERGPH